MNYANKKRTPFVSVILPVYNGEAFLAEAIESILSQDYQPLEIIVVNDGSTDRTATIAKKFGEPVRCLDRSNGGPAAARNTGLRFAQGDVIGFLDADDLWAEGSIALQLAGLAANPTAGISLGYAQILLLTSHQAEAARFQPWSEPKSMLLLQCALVQRWVFAQIGNFSEAHYYAEDVDWFMRVREEGIPIVRQPTATVLVRRHSQNMTNQQGQSQRGLAIALKRSVERRQSRNGTTEVSSLSAWTEWQTYTEHSQSSKAGD